MIKAINIEKSYGELQVLKKVTIEVKNEEVIAIVGASGAGKTTLLHILGTLEKADKGHVQINKKDITCLKDNELSSFRNTSIGFVFQFHNLLPEFNAIENICMPAFIAGTPKKEAEKNAIKLLKILNLSNRAKHKPDELSGGEQQRIAVARALINNPAIILADEPSGNLDSKNADELHQLFFKLNKEMGQTFVIVTHNQTLANMADRKLIMKDGMIT